MKLLKIRFDHVRMFENGIFELDFYASDKVPSSDESVFSLGRPVYSNCIVALAGINASGKTTALNLLVEWSTGLHLGPPACLPRCQQSLTAIRPCGHWFGKMTVYS